MIKRRFPEELSIALDDSVWWDWDDKSIASRIDFFSEKLTTDALRRVKEE